MVFTVDKSFFTVLTSLEIQTELLSHFLTFDLVEGVQKKRFLGPGLPELTP